MHTTVLKFEILQTTWKNKTKEKKDPGSPLGFACYITQPIQPNLGENGLDWIALQFSLLIFFDPGLCVTVHTVCITHMYINTYLDAVLWVFIKAIFVWGWHCVVFWLDVSLALDNKELGNNWRRPLKKKEIKYVLNVKTHEIISDEFELKFPELSRAELERLRSEPSQAELGHLNFWPETELKLSWIYVYQ